MMEAADHRCLDDPAFVMALHRSWLRGVLVEGEVRSGPVVVDEVLAQQATQMGLVQHHDVVETLAAEGADRRRLQPARGCGGAGAAAGSAGEGLPLHSAPALGPGATDGEHGWAAPVSVSPALERRLHGAAPRSPGAAGALGCPRAAAAATSVGLPWAPRPAGCGDIVQPFVKGPESRASGNRRGDFVGEASVPPRPWPLGERRPCRASRDRSARGHRAPPGWPRGGPA